MLSYVYVSVVTALTALINQTRQCQEVPKHLLILTCESERRVLVERDMIAPQL